MAALATAARDGYLSVSWRAGRQLAAETVVVVFQSELLYAKHEYRADFERALIDALAVLGSRDRTILLLQVERNVSVESIGKMYGVWQSTSSRWLARARVDVVEKCG